MTLSIYKCAKLLCVCSFHLIPLLFRATTTVRIERGPGVITRLCTSLPLGHNHQVIDPLLQFISAVDGSATKTCRPAISPPVLPSTVILQYTFCFFCVSLPSTRCDVTPLLHVCSLAPLHSAGLDHRLHPVTRPDGPQHSEARLRECTRRSGASLRSWRGCKSCAHAGDICYSTQGASERVYCK
jgi:hypothetical protein